MPSRFELLPREVRDQIYGEILPMGKWMPLYYDQAPHFGCLNMKPEGILTVNRKIYAEAVAFLYATNTVILSTFYGTWFGSDEMAPTEMSFWRRRGSLVQHVHMDVRWKTIECLSQEEYYRAIIVPAYAARVWQWERTALREAASNDLQTMTLEIKDYQASYPEERFDISSTPTIIAMLQVLLEVLAFGHVTLQWRQSWEDRISNHWEGTVERRSNVGEGGESGFVKHLIIRGDRIAVIDEIRRFLCDSWSLTPQLGMERL